MIAMGHIKVKPIILTGLIAGLMDGLAASLQYAIVRGGTPAELFNFVASGVFGPDALSGGIEMTILGVLFHLVIAIIWTSIYILAYPLFNKIIQNWVVLGLVYGMLVWTCMNFVVLPLSNTPPLTYTLKSIFAGMAIIVLCVGLPIAYRSKKIYL